MEKIIVVSPPGYSCYHSWRWEFERSEDEKISECFYVRNLHDRFDFGNKGFGIVTRMEYEGTSFKSQSDEGIVRWSERNSSRVLAGIERVAKFYAVEAGNVYKVPVAEINKYGVLVNYLLV
jgi:hypothetical protein